MWLACLSHDSTSKRELLPFSISMWRQKNEWHISRAWQTMQQLLLLLLLLPLPLPLPLLPPPAQLLLAVTPGGPLHSRTPSRILQRMRVASAGSHMRTRSSTIAKCGICITVFLTSAAEVAQGQ